MLDMFNGCWVTLALWGIHLQSVTFGEALMTQWKQWLSINPQMDL